jgi:hypothetical protein
MEKTVKKVCHCENCGNESEMIITCSLPDDISPEKEIPSEEKKMKGAAVCSHCGNEADMWIDY